VVYIETEPHDLIVLNPSWLCGEVLAKLLGGRWHLPRDGRISATHLTDLFLEIDVADSASLLIALELCSPVDTGSTYRISCRNLVKVPDEEFRQWDSPYPCVGGIALVADYTAHLRYVFPRVQHAIWNSSYFGRQSEWENAISCSSEASSDDRIMMRIDTEQDEDVIRIICCGCNSQLLYQLQQIAADIVIRVLDSCCPGVYLQFRALSPRDIRDENRLYPRAYLTRSVVSAQLEGMNTVRIDVDGVEESLTEVLAYGDEGLHSRLRPGVDLYVSQLPMYIRCRLAALLDPAHPHGRDWLLLALGLGLADHIPQVDAPEMASLSRTVCILALWSRDQDATIRRLIEVVRQNVQRPDVEDVLLQLAPLCLPLSGSEEHPVCPRPETDRVSTAEPKVLSSFGT